MQTQKITDITENKQRDLQLIYSCDVNCNHSIITSPSSSTFILVGSPCDLVKPHMFHLLESERCEWTENYTQHSHHVRSKLQLIKGSFHCLVHKLGVGCTKNNLCYNLGVKEQLLANFLSIEPKWHKWIFSRRNEPNSHTRWHTHTHGDIHTHTHTHTHALWEDSCIKLLYWGECEQAPL